MSKPQHPRKNTKWIGAVGMVAVLVVVVAVAVGQAVSNQTAKTLTATLRLGTSTVHSGDPVRGELVVHNPTSKAKVILHGCETDGLYAIGFRATNGYMDASAFSLVGCDEDQASNELIADPGTTVFHFHTQASYAGCSGGAELPKKYSPAWSPPCLKGSEGQRDIIPPLPPGRYSAVFVPNGTLLGLRVRSTRLLVTPRR